MLDKLAEELREARKKTGFSLLQISARSKIDLKFLEAMEKGNFSFLPEIYVKAFIKDFSNIIDLDPLLMLKKYDAYKMGRNYEEIKPAEAAQPPSAEIKPEPPVPVKSPEIQPQVQEIPAEKKSEEGKKKKSFKSRKKEAASPSPYLAGPTFDAVAKKSAPSAEEDEKKRRNMISALSAAGGVILLILIYFLFFNKPTEIVVTERPIEEVIKQKERFSDPNTHKNAPNAVLPSADSLSLLIKAKDTSWVKIILDDSDQEEFILFPQSQKVIKAKNNYKITFGNYSRVELFLNDKPLDRGTNKKSVVHVLIDSTGLKYLNIPPAI
ncbi:MAG TPA: RodZ domain-containing protein [Ignavibacteriaceae bacterium]|nr:RodZ domain-containing protein [Ignavibacteriaceae bacterium]